MIILKHFNYFVILVVLTKQGENVNEPTLKDSLTYSPNELGFGTSGLRGLVSDMTDLECYINVSGFITFLEDGNLIDKDSVISIAGDLRKSTPRITEAVATAIEESGYKVEFCGSIPTPALALWSIDHGRASIMITGSHIPADRNGIKFYKPSGEILKSDETMIKKSVAQVRKRIYSSTDGSFTPEGSLTKRSNLPPIQSSVASTYLLRHTELFSNQPFQGKHIVVYQHSAVGRDLLVELFESLGATVTAADRSEEFIPIDTENVTQQDQKHFTEIAQKYPDVFAIVSTDGDSDRPFVIDESGTFHRGDVVGAVVAKALGADFAAIPVSSSDAVDLYMEKQNISVEHTRIGSPYVIDAMNDAEGSHAARVGWEVNGGFLIGSDLEYQSKTLSPLATRDAFLPILITLHEAVLNSLSVSELMSQLPQRSTQAGLIDNFSIDSSMRIVATLKKQDDTAHNLLNSCFTSKDGFSNVVSINTIDGIRIRFKNDEIAHIRPSGNAPQLRIYSVADTQSRADEIVALGIAENGILRRLEENSRN